MCISLCAFVFFCWVLAFGHVCLSVSTPSCVCSLSLPRHTGASVLLRCLHRRARLQTRTRALSLAVSLSSSSLADGVFCYYARLCVVGGWVCSRSSPPSPSRPTSLSPMTSSLPHFFTSACVILRSCLSSLRFSSLAYSALFPSSMWVWRARRWSRWHLFA